MCDHEIINLYRTHISCMWYFYFEQFDGYYNKGLNSDYVCWGWNGRTAINTHIYF